LLAQANTASAEIQAFQHDTAIASSTREAIIERTGV
jgi:hypothetical protein